MNYSITKSFVSNIDITMYVYNKHEKSIAKSIDPDEMAHYGPSHLSLRCLQILLSVCSAERV